MVILLTLFIISCTSKIDYHKGKIEIDGKTIEVLVADSTLEQRKGLMDIPYISDRKGMLFLFDESKSRSFWMKNTQFPIDAFFMDDSWTITGMITMEPCVEDPCEVYVFDQPTKYVLEVNKGVYDFPLGTTVVFTS